MHASGGTYFPNGDLSALTLGNGQVWSAVQDARQLVTSAQAVKGSVNAFRRSYAYDANRRITAITDQAVSGENRAFTYDALSRLATASGPWGAGSYSYDALGNLTGWTQGTASHTTVWDAATNRPTSATTTGPGTRAIAHDARGNVTGLGPLSFTYDAANQPVAVSGAASGTYVYDGHLKRVKQVLGGVATYSVCFSLTGRVSVLDNATTGERFNLLSLGPVQVRVPATGAAVYTHLDHLGSPVAATDTAGAVALRAFCALN